MKRQDRCYISKTLRGCDKNGTNSITQGVGCKRSTKHYCDVHYQEQLDWSEDTVDDIEFQFKSPDLFKM